MKRRSLFKLLACATAAAAMDALGLMPTTKAEVTYFEPWNYTGEVRWINVPAGFSCKVTVPEKYYAAMMKAYEPQPIRWGTEVKL